MKQSKTEWLGILKFFEHEEEDYLGNFWSNNYTEYESKGYRNKMLPIEEYLNKFRPDLKVIINDLKKSDT